MKNLFPIEPRPTQKGFAPIIASCIFAAAINGLVVAITALPLLLLLKVVF